MIDHKQFMVRVKGDGPSAAELTDEELDQVAGGWPNGATVRPPPDFVQLGYQDGLPFPYWDNLPYTDAPPPPFIQWV